MPSGTACGLNPRTLDGPAVGPPRPPPPYGLTRSLHEGLVEVEGEQRLREVPEEVLEDARDHVDVLHLAERREGLASQQLLLQLLHLAVRAGETVQAHLHTVGGGSALMVE